jgi:hypothetical protein
MSDQYDNIEFLAYDEQHHENFHGTSSSSSSKVFISADNVSNFLLLNSFSTDIAPIAVREEEVEVSRTSSSSSYQLDYCEQFV